MKIGILTFHHAANYGAVWQAISLSDYLASLGHDVEIIDFRPMAAVRAYRRACWSGRHIPWNLLKSWRLARDLHGRVAVPPTSPITDPSRLFEMATRYDAVVVGSDEVWNIEGMRGWQPSYFLDFVPDDVRKISYAASTGHRIDVSPRRQEMTRLLQRFRGISVRDMTTAEVVSDLIGKAPHLVIDPTLLVGPRQAPARGAHIALYGGLDHGTKKWLQLIVRKQHLQIVSIGFSNRVGGRIRIAAGLEEWLDTLGSARCVLTTTFHGVMAALVQRRPFWVLPRHDRATKVLQFLEQFHLESRFLDPLHLPDRLNCEEDLNFTEVWQHLSAEITRSKAFLTQALDPHSPL